MYSLLQVTFMLTAVAFSFYAGWSTLGVLGLGSLLAFYALGMGCLPWTIAAEVCGAPTQITYIYIYISATMCTYAFILVHKCIHKYVHITYHMYVYYIYYLYIYVCCLYVYVSLCVCCSHVLGCQTTSWLFSRPS